MMMTDWYLSNKLGVIPNFDKITDTQTQKTELSFRIGHDFMIDLSFKGDPERIRTINEAEMCVRESLNEVYVGATSKYYEWLIKSILKFPFPEVEIPDVGQSKSDFIIPYDATKTDLYNKIRYIKRKVYPKAKGSEYLARVFNDSTKNFNDERVLDFVLLKSKM